MAALTAGRKVISKKLDVDAGGLIVDYSIAASTTIYEGAFVQINGSGYLIGVTGTSVEPTLGIALETVDNSSGSNGDLTAKVLVGGVIEHNVAATTIANIGDPVYASDDQTLDLTATQDAPTGWIVNFISGDNCVVKMNWPGQPAV